MPDAPLLPLIVQPETLAGQLDDPRLLIVDLGTRESYAASHLPGAVHLDYEALTGELPAAPGPIPETLPLAEALAGIGIAPGRHIVAYDDGDNAKAARLLWTLDLIGHHDHSLLDGGLTAWVDECHPIERQPATARPVSETYRMAEDPPLADLLYILRHLGDDDVTIVDARTPAEYRGEDLRARRGGHIPGAVNLDHRRLLDPARDNRLLPRERLRALVEEVGLDPGHELICHCHSHRRSALVYVALKWLGFPRLKAYPGSWAEWGNNLDTPIE